MNIQTSPAIKRRSRLTSLRLAVFFGWAPLFAYGGINLESATVASGITSTGGSFQLQALIGQPAAGSILTGGSFELQAGMGGSVTLLQTPEAPFLQIALVSSDEVRISWPSTAEDYQLEYCTDLRLGVWKEETATILKTAASRAVVVPAKGVRCYRLKRIIAGQP